MTTVEDLRRDVLPPATEILGGEEGLNRTVDWATSLRTRPPAFDAVRGGEVALITVNNIHLLDPRLQLTDIIDSFAAKGGVAVAIVGQADKSSIALANQLKTPLLRLPMATRPEEVQHAITRYLLDQRTLLHELSQEIQNRLMRLVLSGANADALVKEIHEIASCPVIWQGVGGEILHQFPANSDQKFDLHSIPTLLDSLQGVPVQRLPLGEGLSRLVAPIAGQDHVVGFLSLIIKASDTGQLTRIALERGAAVCAVELDRRQAVTAVRDEVEGEVLDALLAGSYTSEEAIAKRASRLGFRLDGEVLVMLLRADLQRWDGAMVAIKSWARQKSIPILAGIHADAFCILISTNGRAEELAGQLFEVCNQAVSGSLFGSTGSVEAGYAGVRRSYANAQATLQLAQKLGRSGLADYARLGLPRLLLSLTNRPEVAEFYRENMQAIVRQDSRGDLLRTLDAYFAANCSPTEAAQRLHLHRNTVLYRLRRVEEISGKSLDDPSVRLAFHLCLRIGEVGELTGRP